MSVPSVFIVTEISLADTPVDCRRGVMLIDRRRTPSGWQLVVYDPRPSAFAHTAGLELPFSCRDPEGTLLTGWVTVGAGDAQLGVQCLRGLGRLRSRPLWHIARSRQGAGPARGQLGPTFAAGENEEVAAAAPPSGYAVPSLLRRLGTRRALAAVAVLCLCAWGALSLALDIGESVQPLEASATVTASVPGAPVLSLRVAIVERLGFSHRWVELRDCLALRVLRTNGATELHALLPGPDCALATDRGGRCELVMCDLLGERQRYRAVVRQRRMDGGSVYLAGMLAAAE